MRQSLRIVARVMLIGGVGLVATQAHAQLKVGKNPTSIERSAILDLDADKQGLLLPRLADTTGINTLTPPDGMVIYVTTGSKGFYVRNNGHWEKMAYSGSSWGFTGNNATINDFIGTLNNVPFSIRANNKEGLVVNDGYVFLKTLDATTTGVEALLIEADGKVTHRTLSSGAFAAAMKINGDGTAAQTLSTDDAANYKFTHDAAGDHKLSIVTQDGTKTVGLLSKADWDRLDASAKKVLELAGFDLTPTAEGLKLGTNGTNPTLSLTAASIDKPGGVSVTAQTFGGNKTFANNLTVEGTTTLNDQLTITKNGANITGATKVTGTLEATGATTLGNTLGVTGAATLSSTLGVTGATTLGNTLDVTGVATMANDLHVKENTILDKDVTLTAIADGSTQKTVLLRDGTSGKIVKRDLSATAFKDLTFDSNHDGVDLKITEDANSKVTVSIPYAEPSTTGGLVSNQSQGFAGAKRFGDEVAVQKNVKIGDTANAANSTLQVVGSLAMSITTVKAATATYTVKATDNTVLVGTTVACAVTLPDAKLCEGRIYTIKKVPAITAPDDTNITNTVTINATAGKIEGGTSIAIYNDWTFYTIQSDGNDWYIIKK